MVENQDNLEVSESKKTKDPKHRTTQFSDGHLCLREENLSNNNIYII